MVLMDEKYMCMVVWERRRRDLGGRAVRSGGVVSWDPLLGGGYAVEVLGLPDVPVQCRPVRVGEDGLGQGRGGSIGSSSVVCSWQVCGDGGSAERGGQSGVEWSYPHRQHTQ